MYPRDYFDTYWRPDLLDEVFVAMPFSDEFDAIWQSVIRPAIEDDQARNLLAHRVDATVLAGSVITEIVEGVARGRLVLADICITTESKWAGQRNGNVMYEVGLAHALRQATEVLLIRSDREPLSFDVSGIKTYDYDRSNLPVARQRLALLIKDHLEQIEQFKSLRVQIAIRSLDGECLKLLKNYVGVPTSRTLYPNSRHRLRVSFHSRWRRPNYWSWVSRTVTTITPPHSTRTIGLILGTLYCRNWVSPEGQPKRMHSDHRWLGSSQWWLNFRRRVIRDVSPPLCHLLIRFVTRPEKPPYLDTGTGKRGLPQPCGR